MEDIEKVIKDLDELYRLIYQSNVDGEILGSLHDAIALLKDQQDVVRCKDCLHWDDHMEECSNSDSICFRNGWTKPEWFCADGERKE